MYGIHAHFLDPKLSNLKHRFVVSFELEFITYMATFCAIFIVVFTTL